MASPEKAAIPLIALTGDVPDNAAPVVPVDEVIAMDTGAVELVTVLL